MLFVKEYFIKHKHEGIFLNQAYHAKPYQWDDYESELTSLEKIK